MKKRSILNSPRLLELKKQKHKTLIRKIYIFSAVFFVFLICLSLLSRWKNLNIANIEIEGNKTIEKDILEGLIKEKISGNYLFLFPKTNFVFYPKSSIEQELRAKFKRIQDIKIELKDLRTLAVTFTERTAKYTWCGFAPESPDQVESETEQENNCYFMDDTGYLFDKAPYFSGEVYLKFYGSINAEDGDPSGGYFKKEYWQKLQDYQREFEQMNLELASFYIDDNADIKAYLPSSTNGGLPYIMFKAESDVTQVMDNLRATLDTEPLATDFKNKYSKLLYIDLRFGNKVYYKFSEE